MALRCLEIPLSRGWCARRTNAGILPLRQAQGQNDKRRRRGEAMGESLASMGPAVANHLWQSTAFAVVAGLLTLALRRNHARARGRDGPPGGLVFRGLVAGELVEEGGQGGAVVLAEGSELSVGDELRALVAVFGTDAPAGADVDGNSAAEGVVVALLAGAGTDGFEGCDSFLVDAAEADERVGNDVG